MHVCDETVHVCMREFAYMCEESVHVSVRRDTYV